MNWIKVKIATSTEGIDTVSEKLSGFGILDIEILDKEDFKEFLENNRKYWDYVDEEIEKLKSADTMITFYLLDDSDGKEKLDEIKYAFDKLKAEDNTLGNLNFEIENVKDEDWSENWKQYFKPIEIGKDILVCPEWEEVPKTKRKVLRINSGMSFGTGTHESTRMCIEELEKTVKTGNVVTDLGCGSGILSVISLILGAERVYAVDIDSDAVSVTYSNLKLNNFDETKLLGFSGDVTKDKDIYNYLSENKADVVVANIVADVIIMLSAFVKSFMKQGGTFICSGIIKERTDEVKNALEEKGFIINNIRTEGEWSVIVAK